MRAELNVQTHCPNGMCLLNPKLRSLFLMKSLSDYLGISEVYAVTGGSYGSMAALAYAVRYPVKRAIIISATYKAHINQIMIRGVQAKLLEFMLSNSGNTPEIVGLVKLIVLLHYRKLHIYESFLKTEQDVSSYLFRACEKMSANVDLPLYKNALKMMDHFDVSEKITKAGTEFFILAVTSDNMYTVEQLKNFHDDLILKGIKSSFEIIDSNKGHDTFLMDEEKLIPYFNSFLG
jgi:homoserine O-acetyltransferase/O-succinyltransferase